MVENKIILSHDLGTAGNKAAFVTIEGELIATAYQEYEVKSPKPGWAEQDPETWWNAIVSTTRELLDKTRMENYEVEGISFDAMLLGAIPVGKDGEPLRPAIIWLDTRAKEESEEFLEKCDIEYMLEEDVIPPLSPKDPIPKYMWIKNHEPDVFENTYKFLEAKGYLIQKCTNNFVSDPSEASLTGTYSLSKRERVPDVLESIGIPMDKFPEIRDAQEIVGELTEEASEELGLSEGIPVVCGSGDPTAAAIGSGAVGTGKPHMYIGSSGWIALHTEELDFKLSGVGTICSADPKKFLLIGESESCASCYEWFKNELSQKEREKADKEGISTFEVMDRKAKKAPPGSDGLLFVPWMSGERCPFIDPMIRGGFLNLSFSHEKNDMIRAVLEGVAYNIRWIKEEIVEMGHEVSEINAIGGGAKSDLWLQIMADVLNEKIRKMPNPSYAGCIGTALTAALAFDYYDDFSDFDDVFEPEKIFSPEEENVGKYDQLYEQFKQVQENISPVCSAINEEF